MNKKTELKFFTISQYREEECYLEKMHKKGWKFVKVTFPGFYQFEECAPEDVVYQLDYNPDAKSNHSEYIGMFRDCGWEYMFDFVGYSYFRKPKTMMNGDGREEIFSDDESRLDMMKRVFKGRVIPLLGIFFFCLLPQFLMNTLQYGEGSVAQKILSYAFAVLIVLYLLLFLTIGIQLFQYEKKVQGNRYKLKIESIVFVTVIICMMVLCMALLLYETLK